MLKWKGSKENGSQALIPEEKTKREAPVEQLWERNREGRKETNRKPSTETRKDWMGNQTGKNGENVEAKAEAKHCGSHCEAEAGRAERKKQKAK